jgi:hypothetical protein
LEESFRLYLDYLLYTLVDPEFDDSLAAKPEDKQQYMRAVHKIEREELATWRCLPASLPIPFVAHVLLCSPCMLSIFIVLDVMLEVIRATLSVFCGFRSPKGPEAISACG